MFVEEEERDRLVCDACGEIHYINPKIVAGTIPVTDGRVWLLRRAIDPRLGFWTFPAGFMEMGETVPQAAERETLEELNLHVRLGPLLGLYSLPTMTTVHAIYLAEAISEPSSGKEALEFAAFGPKEIPWRELAFWTTRMALRDWVGGRS
jgi:ADP-ribose pyrophosphatase YjhB (NUDIX family)